MYLEVDVQSHMIVPDLDNSISSSCKMLTITTHIQTGRADTMNIGHLQKKDHETNDGVALKEKIHMRRLSILFLTDYHLW